MTTEQPTSPAAERLAALLDLAREQDDDLNYVEVELLVAAARTRRSIREAPLAQTPAPPKRGRARAV